jgi:hypothetical protein
MIHPIHQFILTHQFIAALFAIDLVVGLILMRTGINRWRRSGKLWDMWMNIDWFITVDIPYTFATIGGRASGSYRGRGSVQMPFEFAMIIAFCWILVICQIGKFISNKYRGLRLKRIHAVINS